MKVAAIAMTAVTVMVAVVVAKAAVNVATATAAVIATRIAMIAALRPKAVATTAMIVATAKRLVKASQIANNRVRKLRAQLRSKCKMPTSAAPPTSKPASLNVSRGSPESRALIAANAAHVANVVSAAIVHRATTTHLSVVNCR